MITEKGIKDSQYCPCLWTEPKDHNKRVKPDNRIPDNTLQLIYEALTINKPNKKMIPHKTVKGIKVEAYEESFWIVINAGGTDLLLAISEVRLERDVGGSWTLFVKRNQRKKSNYIEYHNAESMVRKVLAKAFKEYFTKVKIIVETKYGDDTQVEIDEVPKDDELVSIYDFFENIVGMAEGSVLLKPRHDRCHYCRFKECDYRLKPLEVEGSRSGKPFTEIL